MYSGTVNKRQGVNKPSHWTVDKPSRGVNKPGGGLISRPVGSFSTVSQPSPGTIINRSGVNWHPKLVNLSKKLN